MKDTLESRTNKRTEGDYQVALRMVMHAATVVNKWRRDDEGLTAHRRWKVREFTRSVAEFGECVMYLPAASVGKKKFNVRLMDGVWLGIKLESGESIVGTADGVVKARDFRREPEEGGRWSSDGFDGLKAGGGFDQVEGQTAAGQREDRYQH